jgi:phospholipid N-methyltransferase
MPKDFASFFLAWMSSPRRVGAIAPSGAALADLITRDIGPSTGPVLELGPGTGAFTYKLLERGVRPENLTLVEYGSDFMRLLQMRFPAARVLWMDAARLASEPLYDGAPVGAVVSGLPLLNMSTRKLISIVGGAFSYVRPGGALLPIHLRPDMSDPAASSRPARAQGQADGPRTAECAAGRCLQADPAASDEDRHRIALAFAGHIDPG